MLRWANIERWPPTDRNPQKFPSPRTNSCASGETKIKAAVKYVSDRIFSKHVLDITPYKTIGAPTSIFSCNCLSTIMVRSVNCLKPKYTRKAVQVRLIGAKPIVQVRRWNIHVGPSKLEVSYQKQQNSKPPGRSPPWQTGTLRSGLRTANRCAEALNRALKNIINELRALKRTLVVL